ncbi:hypothetical protein TELCIR_01885 [Teladorsagia circumcincta]|uniref:Uncharacterized protein n=1 Tax=Teladorsagia circumcincta TaxID=45464 RepID=A0A2G9V0M3_TELCI|nr:hypothetical protein TELCIR_01885 [Teladorsagia circumcincta]
MVHPEDGLIVTEQAMSIVAPQMAEHKMMREYPAPPGLSDKDLKKFYNKKMVIWDNNYSYVNLPIACIVGIMYVRILIWSPSTDISLYWFYPTAAITGLMGDFFLTMSCVNAYVADRFDDEKVLSTRMIVVSIMFSLGAFIASQITKAILNKISSTVLLIIVEDKEDKKANLHFGETYWTLIACRSVSLDPPSPTL